MHVTGGGGDLLPTLPSGLTGGQIDPLASAQHLAAWTAQQAALHGTGGNVPPPPGSDDGWEVVPPEAQIADAALQAVMSTLMNALSQIGAQLSALQQQRTSGPALTPRSKFLMIVGAGAGVLTLVGGAIYGAFRVAEYAIQEAVARLSLSYDNSHQNQLGNQTVVYYLEGPTKHHASSDLAVYAGSNSMDPQQRRALRLEESEKKLQLRNDF